MSVYQQLGAALRLNGERQAQKDHLQDEAAKLFHAHEQEIYNADPNDALVALRGVRHADAQAEIDERLMHLPAYEFEQVHLLRIKLAKLVRSGATHDAIQPILDQLKRIAPNAHLEVPTGHLLMHPDSSASHLSSDGKMHYRLLRPNQHFPNDKEPPDASWAKWYAREPPEFIQHLDGGIMPFLQEAGTHASLARVAVRQPLAQKPNSLPPRLAAAGMYAARQKPTKR